VLLWVIGLLFVFWNIESFILSETRNYGFDEIIRSTSYVFLFFWAARLRIHKEGSLFEKRFPQVVTAAAALAAIIGTAIYTLQPVNRFVGTFVDARFDTDYWPNAWAEFTLFAWPLALLLALQQGKRKTSWMHYILLGLIFASLALSYSRGAVLAFVGQIIMMIVLFGSVIVRDIRYRRILRTSISSGVLALSLVIATIAIGFTSANALRSLTYDVQSVSEKVTFTAAEGTSSISERAQFWEQAKLFTLQRPIFGWGPYSFRFVQPMLMKGVLATSDHAHNILLKYAMERGIASAVFFVGLFGSVFAYAIFSFLHSRKAYLPESDASIVLLITALTGVMLHNLIDFNLQFVGIGVPCMISLGLLVHPVTHTHHQTLSFHAWKLRKSLQRMDTLIACVLLITVCYEGIFLATSSLGRHALAAGDDRAALAWFQRSHASIFTRDLYLSEAQIQMRLGDLEDAESSLDTYGELNAVDLRVWKLRGELHLRQDKAQEAVLALEEAYTRGKYTDLSILELFLIAQRKAGETEELYARKLEFDALFSEYATAIEQNIHFIDLSQNVEALQAVSRQLSELFPNDAERYKIITRKAVSHAKEERDRYDARPPGMLW
jgi:O-antigen ligase